MFRGDSCALVTHPKDSMLRTCVKRNCNVSFTVFASAVLQGIEHQVPEQNSQPCRITTDVKRRVGGQDLHGRVRMQVQEFLSEQIRQVKPFGIQHRMA